MLFKTNYMWTSCDFAHLLIFQLFDLLGFERFTLIENLLHNRQKVVRSAFGCEESSTASAYAGELTGCKILLLLR